MSFLYCKFCNVTKEESEFHRNKNSRTGRTNKCKECTKKHYLESGLRERLKLRWDNDAEFRERYSTRNSKRRIAKAKNKRDRRNRLLEKYGGKCECCGEDRFEFLAIDHRNGGGNIERKTISRDRLLTILLKTDGILHQYRILCHNCNMALGFYGHCPHESNGK